LRTEQSVDCLKRYIDADQSLAGLSIRTGV
jgi:hypothetical protein